MSHIIQIHISGQNKSTSGTRHFTDKRDTTQALSERESHIAGEIRISF